MCLRSWDRWSRMYKNHEQTYISVDTLSLWVTCVGRRDGRKDRLMDFGWMGGFPDANLGKGTGKRNIFFGNIPRNGYCVH